MLTPQPPVSDRYRRVHCSGDRERPFSGVSPRYAKRLRTRALLLLAGIWVGAVALLIVAGPRLFSVVLGLRP